MENEMQRESRPYVHKLYSRLFIFICFTLFLSQLAAPGMTLDGISGNFLSRKALIKKLNTLRFFMGDQVYPSMIVGKDGWLFYIGNKSIQDYQRTLHLKTKKLLGFESALVSLEKAVVENGGRLIVIIAPDKSTIYPQYMPDNIPILGQESRTDQFLEFMQQKNDIKVIDLRPALIQASLSNQVYYKTDSHWNCLGAYSGYQEIISEISAYFPELQAYSVDDFEMVLSNSSTRDIPRMMGLSGEEEVFSLIPKFPASPFEVKYESEGNDKGPRVVVNSGQSSQPSVLLFHDSFYTNACMAGLFELHFSRVASIPSASINIQDYMQLIRGEKPDIVIVEFVERNIEKVLMHIQVVGQ
jgi:alginate O-acetyltransferase complex protein AlgJ